MIGYLIEAVVGVGLEAARESSLKDNFIPSAVNIARHQGWVSPHRMSNQLGVGRRDAQIVLFAACNRGLLYQANNGRYYPVEQAVEQQPLINLTMDVSGPFLDDAEATKPAQTGLRAGKTSIARRLFMISCVGVPLSALAFAGLHYSNSPATFQPAVADTRTPTQSVSPTAISAALNASPPKQKSIAPPALPVRTGRGEKQHQTKNKIVKNNEHH